MSNSKKMKLILLLIMFLIVFLPLKVEAKTKTVSYNIDKISANNFVKDVQSKGNNSGFDGFYIHESWIDDRDTTSLRLDDWMLCYPKEYKNLSLEKAAYKFGISMIDSELNQIAYNLYI